MEILEIFMLKACMSFTLRSHYEGAILWNVVYEPIHLQLFIQLKQAILVWNLSKGGLRRCVLNEAKTVVDDLMNLAIILNFYVQLLNITLMALSAPWEKLCLNFMTERKTEMLPTTKLLLSVADKTINSNLWKEKKHKWNLLTLRKCFSFQKQQKRSTHLDFLGAKEPWYCYVYLQHKVMKVNIAHR